MKAANQFPMCGAQTYAGGEAPALRHDALLFRGGVELARGARRFIQDGIDAGEPTLVAVAAKRLESLRAALGGAADRVRLVDADAVGANPARMLTLVADWAERRPGRVRFLAVPTRPRRDAAEVREGARHEALMNLAFAGQALSVLCPYDRADHDPTALAWAKRTHARLATADGSAVPSPGFDPALDVLASSDWPLPEAAAHARIHAFDADLASLRRVVRESDCCAALTPDRCEDFVFALNETAENVVKHGHGAGTIRLWRERRGVVGEVRGPAQIDDPLVGHRRPDPDAHGGRGMWLVNQLSDLVQLRSEDSLTTVRIHMRCAEAA